VHLTPEGLWRFYKVATAPTPLPLRDARALRDTTRDVAGLVGDALPELDKEVPAPGLLARALDWF
jgi:hypothetical protein